MKIIKLFKSKDFTYALKAVLKTLNAVVLYHWGLVRVSPRFTTEGSAIRDMFS